MIRINANLFRMVYSAVSKEETRYYLNGVKIEAHPEKGALLIATDGHRMIVAHDETGVCDTPAIVRIPSFVRAQCKNAVMFKAYRVLEIDAEKRSASLREVTPEEKGKPEKTDDIVTAYNVIIDGTFPDWRRVVPQGGPATGEYAAFNPRFMKEIAALGEDVKRTMNTSEFAMKIECRGSMDPIVIRFGQSPVFGVLMPMRHSIDGWLPAFMNSGNGRLEAAE